MAISDEIRESIRQQFNLCCGYCRVHENESGSQLEIDHFQPRAFGGTDEQENLIYCCSACNKFKHDFWPAENPTSNPRRLLHPLKDNVQEHLAENADGRLIPLSAIGEFHLERLRLNRPQLVAYRKKHYLEKEVHADIIEALAASHRLETKAEELTELLNKALARIERLQGQ
ncbi:MAG: HNH endonuclease signature motif containing protein [Acidobacteriota bacterium]|nr:HNH endonuclease signature motif containing protein [Acidobacteriota bacterium]